MTKVGIGLVGYYQFVRGYPIGPTLKENIDAATWLDVDLVTKEMNWGPIAIVQEFQAEKIEYDRFILVTAVESSLAGRRVGCLVRARPCF